MRYVAVSGWSVAELVAHAPPPVIGSNVAAIADEPAVGKIVFGVASFRCTSPGASDAHVGAVYGPPEAAEFGHVSVSAFTPVKGKLPMPLTK